MCLRSNVAVEPKSVSGRELASDEDGICEDASAGYDLIRITVPDTSESPDEVGPLNANAPKTGTLPGLLAEIWGFYGRKTVFTLLMDDWTSKDPGLAGVLGTLDPSLVEVFPNNRVCGSNGQPRAFTIKILPACLPLLGGGPRLVHRQVTAPDGEKIDLRTMVGRMICTASVANIADVCRCWLADMAYESSPKARRKARILLERVLGFRGEELAAHDPALKQRVMEAVIGGKGKVGTERERERRDR